MTPCTVVELSTLCLVFYVKGTQQISVRFRAKMSIYVTIIVSLSYLLCHRENTAKQNVSYNIIIINSMT